MSLAIAPWEDIPAPALRGCAAPAAAGGWTAAPRATEWLRCTGSLCPLWCEGGVQYLLQNSQILYTYNFSYTDLRN